MSKTNYWLFEKEQQPVRSYLSATVGIGKTDDHFKLKTSDRAPNKVHCREVVELAAKLGEKGMKKVLARYGCTATQLLMAATGRPKKSGKASDKELAETKSGTILNDLRKAAGRQVKTAAYVAGKIVHPESAESIAEDLKQVSTFAEEQAAVIEKRESTAAKRKSKAPATTPAAKRKTA